MVIQARRIVFVVAVLAVLAMAAEEMFGLGIWTNCVDMAQRELTDQEYFCGAAHLCPIIQYHRRDKCENCSLGEDDDDCTGTHVNQSVWDSKPINYEWQDLECEFEFLGKKEISGDFQFSLYPTQAALTADGAIHVKTVAQGSCDCFGNSDGTPSNGHYECEWD